MLGLGGLLLCVLACLVACGDSTSAPSPGVPPPLRATDVATGAAESFELLDFESQVDPDRPAELRAPPGSKPDEALPLVLLLHGYTINGSVQESYWGLSKFVQELGFRLLVPNGTVIEGATGRFWNGGPACCDFAEQGPDDVAYLRALVEEVSASYAVEGVHVLGHSNGGYMVHWLACQAPEFADGHVSVAGLSSRDPRDCELPDGVRMLLIHGALDQDVPYEGEQSGDLSLLGAQDLARAWAEASGCDADSVSTSESLDLDGSVEGAETEVLQYDSACRGSAEVALWSGQGVGHLPVFTESGQRAMLRWLLEP